MENYNKEINKKVDNLRDIAWYLYGKVEAEKNNGNNFAFSYEHLEALEEGILALNNQKQTQNIKGE